ncbi:MAG TPA: amidohydrolase family protein [Dissulfurispiraceae bacterium]|nr:amidohydrolase family protein [Dissulfurispiraceae bacterium]
MIGEGHKQLTHIFCGNLIDGSGGPVQNRILIRIERGVIDSLDEIASREQLPSETVDLSDFTVLPGLIDCHVHLLMTGSSDSVLRRSQLNYSFEEAIPIITRHLSAQAFHGIIALRDGGDYGGYALRFKREVLSKSSIHTSINCAGRAWRAHGRYGSLIGRAPDNNLSLAQAIAADTDHPDHIKIVNSGINSLTEFGKETRPQFTIEELTQAVKIAGQLGLKTMVHANGRIPVHIAASAGCSSIEHGYFMGEDNLKLLADSGIYWIPTAYPMKAYAEQARKGSREADIAAQNLDYQLEQIRLARRIGVPVAIGTDCGSLGVEHGNSFSEELQLFIEAGFTLPEVVRLATVSAANLLGIGHEFGELRVGGPATFIALQGGPSQLLKSLKSSPVKVYIRGRQFG